MIIYTIMDRTAGALMFLFSSAYMEIAICAAAASAAEQKVFSEIGKNDK